MMKRLILLVILLYSMLLLPMMGWAQTHQPYTSSDGALRFEYPAEWLLADQYPHGILIANSPFAMQNSVEALGRNDIQIGVIVLKLDELFGDPILVEDALDFAELLQNSVQGEQDYVVQSAAQVAHPAYSGARFDMHSANRRVVQLFLMPDGNTIVQILASIDPRDLLIFEPIILQVAASLRFDPALAAVGTSLDVLSSSESAALPLDRSFRSSDGMFAFRHPASWTVTSSSMVASITNFNGNWRFGDPLTDEQMVMTILALPLATYADELPVDPTAEDAAHATTDAEISDIQLLEIGRSAVRFEVNRAGNPNDEFSIVILTDDDQVIQITASSGNMDLYRATVIAIAETVEYTGQ